MILDTSVTGCAAVLPVVRWSGRDQSVADKRSNLTTCMVVHMATHSATKGYHGHCGVVFRFEHLYVDKLCILRRDGTKTVTLRPRPRH